MKTRPFIFVIFFLFVFSHHAVASGWIPSRGKTQEGKKVYLGPVPIQETEAYRKFLQSSRSEIDKLYYIGDRIKAKAAQKNVYVFERDHYNWLEVFGGGMWCLWHYYKRDKTARGFAREMSQRFERAGSRATIEYPDGSVHYAYDVTVNELDLLEETIKSESQTQ